MKRLFLITSAVGLCLAAPAFAQSTPEQDQLNKQRAAPPSTAAPAAQSQDRQRSNQQQMDQGGQAQQRPAAGGPPPSAQAPSNLDQRGQAQQRPATGSPSPSAQAPSGQDQRGQAQGQQQPSSAAPASSAQAPAPSGQAQSPAADQTQRGQAQNQRDPAADRMNQQQQRSATDRNQPAQGGRAPADQQQQRSATDRNQPAQGGQADRRQSQQDLQRQDRRDLQRQDQRQDAQTSRSQTSTRDRASTSLNVDINETQRTRIASAISSVNVRPVNVNFRVATGVVVPRTVTLHTLPPTIVEVVPQFRGYSYFVTREQIVIVEPRRKTIVAVLPASGTARAQAPAASRATFTDQHREVIRSRASSLRSTATVGSSVSRIVVEQEVPATIELEEFPVEIVTEVPVVRSYRYFVQENDVFVVDPVERRVIEIIR